MDLDVGEFISGRARSSGNAYVRPLIFSMSRKQQNLLGCVGQRVLWLSREGMSLDFSRKAEDVVKK